MSDDVLSVLKATNRLEPNPSLGVAIKEIERLREKLAKIKSVVEHQANDPSLWIGSVFASEERIQQALRRLHVVIEGEVGDE
jgi:hypothetical protein